jgi:hypothetical protein
VEYIVEHVHHLIRLVKVVLAMIRNRIDAVNGIVKLEIAAIMKKELIFA